MATNYQDGKIINNGTTINLPTTGGRLAAGTPLYRHRISFGFISDTVVRPGEDGVCPYLALSIDLELYSMYPEENYDASFPYGGVRWFTYLISHLLNKDPGCGLITLPVHGCIYQGIADSPGFLQVNRYYFQEISFSIPTSKWYADSFSLFTTQTFYDVDLEYASNTKATIKIDDESYSGNVLIKDICCENIVGVSTRWK